MKAKGEPLRLMVVAVSQNPVWCGAWRRLDPAVEVLAVHPRRIDLGDFGATVIDAAADEPYALRPVGVWPRRPYVYSLYGPALAGHLRRFQPHVLLLIGEPSELGVAQAVALAERVSPATRRVCFTFENVDRDWTHGARLLRGWAERRTLRRLDAVVAASTSARERLARLGYPRGQVEVIYPGATPLAPSPAAVAAWRAQLPPGWRTAYVGRLVPEKGVDLLLEALAQLPGEHHLVVAGDGRAGPELRAQAARLGLGDRVRWLGRVAPERVQALLAACDALVLPSRGTAQWQEQFGMVLVEAMRVGLPVVGSSSGAIPEVMGPAGLVFRENDAADLAANLRRLSASEALQRKLAAAGRARARRWFTVETTTRRMLDLFRRLAR